MFSPPKRTLLAIVALVTAFQCFVSSANGQDSEFQRRLAAMREARSRAVQTTQTASNQPTSESQVRFAQQPVEVTTAPARQQVRQATAQMPAIRTTRLATPRRQGVVNKKNFVPKHIRTAQVMNGPILDGGAPIVNSAPVTGTVIQQPGTVMSSQVMGSPIVDGQVMTQPYVESGVPMEGCLDDCGSCGGYFDDCCGRGGCPECQDCWINRFGVLFRNSEFYSGFTSFRSTLFSNPTTTTQNLLDDCSHGYYGGVNFGLPLCRLTCGAFSGQFGIRTVNTNFNGNAFSIDDRNQLFMTAGFFRRSDYGLQFGVVADVLREEWYANADLVQIRGDIGHVWPSGTTFGFKFATNVQDDVVNGTINGQSFTGQTITTNDNYRFYVRHDAKAGGWGEVFAGWSETSQGIIGLDFDMPITNRLAVEAGFTYFLNDDGVPANAGFLGGQQGQAYNTYVGIALRPAGRRYYRNYDRPLFDVADNGSMLTVR